MCQSRFKSMPNTKLALKYLPKTIKILPKRRNFAKSGHNGCGTVGRMTVASDTNICCIFLLGLLVTGKNQLFAKQSFK